VMLINSSIVFWDGFAIQEGKEQEKKI